LSRARRIGGVPRAPSRTGPAIRIPRNAVRIRCAASYIEKLGIGYQEVDLCDSRSHFWIISRV
jgi:hypothetical protein